MKINGWPQLPDNVKPKRSYNLKISLMRLTGYPMTLQYLCRTKRLYIFATCTVALLSWSAWYFRSHHNDLEKKTFDPNDFEKRLKEDSKLSVIENKGEGCVMPQLDPFDEEAMKYEQTLPPGACEGKDWVECFMDECFVTQSIQEKLNVSCVYRDILYESSLQHLLGPPTELNGHQKYLLRQSDHVQVSCHITSQRSGVLTWAGLKTGLRRLPHRKLSRGPRLNIVMLCFNSISKNGFIRKMPESYTALKKMGAVILNGYNTIEDVPSAALFSILTGNPGETRKSFTKNSIDEDSFIFTRLSQMGYHTAFFEDTPILGTYKESFSGFGKPPTDHYLLPFVLQERENRSKASNEYCIGDIPMYRLLLNLTHQFSQLEGNRFSFTFISDLGRDEFNMHSAADEDLAFFLRRLQQGGTLEDTVLFVMGDHGPRLTPFRKTYQGKLEERLPLMAIVVPEHLKQTRPEDVASMEMNIDVLTTPFDIHTTLTDLMLMEFRRSRHKVPGADMERGQTLLQPIPSSRSCGEAGVQPYWCACASWHPLDPLDPMRKTIGRVAADYVNSLTNEWRKDCLYRKLVSVEEVLLLTPQNKLLHYKTKLAQDGYFGKVGDLFQTQSRTYQAKIVMNPGEAVFETILRYYVKGDFFVVTDGDIFRINSVVCKRTLLCFITSGALIGLVYILQKVHRSRKSTFQELYAIISEKAKN